MDSYLAGNPLHMGACRFNCGHSPALTTTCYVFILVMTPIKSRFKKGTKYQQVPRTLSYTATGNRSKLGWFQMHPSLPNSPTPAALPCLKGGEEKRKQSGRKVYQGSSFKHSFACNRIQGREGQRAPRTGSCPRSESLCSELCLREEGRIANCHLCPQAAPAVLGHLPLALPAFPRRQQT